jgi:hypothetical protein
MKRFDSPASSALGAVVLTAWFAACGGLNDGAVTIVDSGGSGGSNSSSNAGGTKNKGSGGSSSGASSSTNGGEGGEPPLVVSDDPPAVVSVTPADEASDGEPDGVIEIEFSESLDPETVTPDTIIVREGDNVVPGKLEFSGVTARFTPDERLPLLAHVNVTVTTGVKDLQGTALEEEFVSSYRVRDGAWGHTIVLSNEVGSLDYSLLPRPVVDERGNALVVWAQSSEANPTVRYVIWGRFFTPGEGWGDAFPISTDGEESFAPVVSMDPGGDAIVSWIQREGSYQRVYARRYVAGVWEEEPQRVDGGDHSSIDRLTVAVTPAGEMHTAWAVLGSTSWYIYRTFVESLGDFSPPSPYDYYYGAGPASKFGGPTYAFAPDGNGFMSWFSGSSQVNMFVARYIRGSAEPWKNAEQIPAGAGQPDTYENAPEIVADEDGGAMVVWRTDAAEVTSSRFTKATGWSNARPLDSSSGWVDWGPRVARVGDEFVAAWIQEVQNVVAVFANRYTDGAWQFDATLLTNGNTSVDFRSGLGFGLDRNGNGVAVWVQDQEVRFARLVGETQEWRPAAKVDKPMNESTVSAMDADAIVAPNGVAIATYAAGYPYERHDILYAAAFD